MMDKINITLPLEPTFNYLFSTACSQTLFGNTMSNETLFRVYPSKQSFSAIAFPNEIWERAGNVLNRPGQGRTQDSPLQRNIEIPIRLRIMRTLWK